MSDFKSAADLLATCKEEILQQWVNVVRDQLKVSSNTPEPVLADHFLEILAHIQRSLELIDQETQPNYDRLCNTDKLNEGSNLHGKQRASVNAYNVEQVYWEYACMRRIISAKLLDNGISGLDCLEAINCIIENNSRAALASFTESLQKVQQKLFGSLVHDIRTPLSTIDSIGQIQISSGESPEVTRQGELLHSSSQRINQMLYEILQTVSIEAGQGFQLTFSDGGFIRNMKILKASLETIYGPRFRSILPDKEPPLALDMSAITRTLENLVSNAFKHGDNDSDVLLKVSVDDKDLRISVHNYGNPISKQDRGEIFEFLHYDEGRKTSEEASWGMGLALAKAAAKGHKGIVRVKSSAADGTEFILILPLGARKDGQTDTVII